MKSGKELLLKIIGEDGEWITETHEFEGDVNPFRFPEGVGVNSGEFEVRTQEIFNLRKLTWNALHGREVNEIWARWTQELLPPIMPRSFTDTPYAILKGESWFYVHF